MPANNRWDLIRGLKGSAFDPPDDGPIDPKHVETNKQRL